MEVRDLPTVSIIVPAFNESKYIETCIQSLLELDYPKELIDITVVDNGSTDDTVLKASQYPITVLSKLGGKVGGVRNYGAEKTKGNILAFIDGDCIAGIGWLSLSVKKLADGSCGAVGGNYLLRENPSWVEEAWVLDNTAQENPVTSLVGGSFLISREVFQSLGGFDELINAGEDTKLTKQVLSLGLGVEFVKESAVIHLGYPDDISGFAKRQFWHASSYIKSNNGIFRDRVFLLVLLFILSWCFLFAWLLFGKPILLFGTLFLVLSPWAFGWHRLKKSNAGRISFLLRLKIFLLDVVYFSSRAAGLISSCFGDPYKK